MVHSVVQNPESVSSQRLFETLDHIIPLERLAQEANRSSSHGPRLGRFIGERRDEDDRHAVPRVFKALCSSIPFMSGIRTSDITHDASPRVEDCKSSSADANACARNPRDLTRLQRNARIESSSSTTEMIGVSDKDLSHGLGFGDQASDPAPLTTVDWNALHKK
jgi:hypothetical protein